MSGPAIPEGELRARARQLIDKGDIPVLKVADIDGGHGRGHVCSVCGQQISNSQIEYEPRGIAWHRPLRFHIKCFAVWQLECAQRIDTQGGSPSRGPSAIDDPDKTGENGDGTHRSRSCSIRLRGAYTLGPLA